MNEAYFGLDKYGRPNLPPFNKVWYEDGGYKGYIWSLEKQRFYFNDIPVEAGAYWSTLTELAFGRKK